MIFDVTIVGGGPAGMYSAFYAGLRDLKTKIVEADVELGGRLRYYPEKTVWDVGGLPPLPGETLRNNLEAQSRTFAPTVVTGQRIVEVDQALDGIWTLTSDTGEHHLSRCIILAIGLGTLGTRRLDVPGTAQFEGEGVHYSLRDPSAFRGKRVVVSGGGDSAVDWAHQLAGTAASVTLVHRRRQFRAHERVVAELEGAGVRVLTTCSVCEIEGCEGILSWVHLVDQAGRCERFAADAVLVGHGMDFSAGKGLLSCAGRPGVFLAGDCIDRPGKPNLIAATFPEAVEAVNAAKLYLEPAAEAQAMVSSHNSRFVGLSV